MSEPTAAPAADQDLFSRDDLKQFASDDVEAGSAIGKMLTLFFAYTVVAMSLVAWWTFSDTAERAAEANGGEAPATAGDH